MHKEMFGKINRNGNLYLGQNNMTLKEHIADCALRYQALENRLDNLEKKMDEVKATIDGFKDFLAMWAVRGAVGLLLLLAGTIFVAKI